MKRFELSRKVLFRAGIILGSALLVASGVLVLVMLLGPRSATPAPARSISTTAEGSPTPELPSPTPEPSPTSSPLVASVNGHTITQSYLQRATALNDVLSEFAGQQSLGSEETLQRLIKQEIVLQGISLEEQLTEQDIEDYIGRMQEAWDIDEETMMSELRAAGVERDFLEETIHRLLSVQAAVASVESQGQSISEWLAKQEEEADIKIHEEMYSSLFAAPEETPVAVAPTPEDETPTPRPDAQFDVPDVAPDFTLDRAGGGSLTLEDQLEEGPVVLVFFEKCG
jgi:hypothetical protein